MQNTPLSDTYQPPTSNLSIDILQLPYQLASRESRLLAALIDGVIGVTCLVPLWLISDDYWTLFLADELSLAMSLLILVYGLIYFIVIHGYLLNKYGQTVGKRLLGIYIANYDSTEKASLQTIFVKRIAIATFIAYIPMIGNIFHIIDALFIFRKDQRCIHDHIAGTHVLIKT